MLNPNNWIQMSPPHTSLRKIEIWVPAFTTSTIKLLQLCPTLCDPIDRSPRGSSVPGILQLRILGWVAIFFSIWQSQKSLSPSLPWSIFSNYIHRMNNQPAFSKQLTVAMKRGSSFLPVSKSQLLFISSRHMTQTSPVFSLPKALCTSFGTPWLIHFLPRGVNDKQKTHLGSLFQAYFLPWSIIKSYRIALNFTPSLLAHNLRAFATSPGKYSHIL